MKYYKIIFESNRKDMIQEVEAIEDYLGCLFKNGQIVEYDSIFTKGEFVFCCLTMPEDESLKLSYNNSYVNKSREKIEQNFSISLEEIGENWHLDAKICKCPSPSYYMLTCNPTHADSPITCGDCGSPVPLYKLPKILGETDFYTVREFERESKAIEDLWISCLDDKFTSRQRNNSSSQLFKKGHKICKAFEQVTGIKFYYQIPLDDLSSTTCPFCGEAFDMKGDFRCTYCQIIVNMKSTF